MLGLKECNFIVTRNIDNAIYKRTQSSSLSSFRERTMDGDMSHAATLEWLNQQKSQEFWIDALYVVVMCVLGACANFVVFLFFLLKKPMKSTNFLLRTSSFTDMVTSLVLLNELVIIFNTYTFENVIGCKVIQYLIHVFGSLSCLMINLLGIDRYFQICMIMSKYSFTVKTAQVCVAGLYVFLLLESLPFFFFSEPIMVNVTTVYDRYNHSVTIYGYNCQRHTRKYGLYLTIVYFVDITNTALTLVCVTIMYSLMARTIAKSNNKFAHSRATVAIISRPKRPSKRDVEVDFESSVTEEDVSQSLEHAPNISESQQQQTLDTQSSGEDANAFINECPTDRKQSSTSFSSNPDERQSNVDLVTNHALKQSDVSVAFTKGRKHSKVSLATDSGHTKGEASMSATSTNMQSGASLCTDTTKKQCDASMSTMNTRRQSEISFVTDFGRKQSNETLISKSVWKHSDASKSTKRRKESSTSNTSVASTKCIRRTRNAQYIITKMMFVLTTFSLISYVPMFIIRLTFSGDVKGFPFWARLLYRSFFINSTINPFVIIYFRTDVREFICSKIPCCRRKRNYM